MKRDWRRLRDDARAIWSAGLAAVDSARLVRDAIEVTGDSLRIDDLLFPLDTLDRIVVVGGGKAGAGMAAGVVDALGDPLRHRPELRGWLNVPDDCVRPLPHITLFGARPPGRNEPTERGVEGTSEILRIVESLGPRDLCLCLLSGGGSALLPAPAAGITLDDKLALTRYLAAAGANILELNTVRKHLSRIKGGRLAARCRAGHLVTLVISDVLGDPLDVIASGPTVDDPSTAEDALRVLDAFGARGVAPCATDLLERLARRDPAPTRAVRHVENRVIGNIARAVDAAGEEAERLGYRHAMIAATRLEGDAESVGEHLAEIAERMLAEDGPDCLVSGGEPTVRLAAPEIRGVGGRNQQLVLAAYARLARSRSRLPSPCQDLVILSGGTDGEDGPTDAAGAWIDEPSAAEIVRNGWDADDALARNDAYPFFARLGTLIKTGPTHTNVCDVRVVLAARER
ncbi:MAG: DUF4147 domain-containing protein [Planctomycetes bacterium]|nr:DUF4147 domain-containing protein [Planctomycetota bacterium]